MLLDKAQHAKENLGGNKDDGIGVRSCNSVQLHMPCRRRNIDVRWQPFLVCLLSAHHTNVNTWAHCRLQRSIGNDSGAVERQRNLESSFPMKRLARPTDIANAAWFLGSDQSSFVTGTTIEVDGGRGI